MSETSNTAGQTGVPATETDNIMQHVQGMIEGLLKNTVNKMQKAETGDALGDTTPDEPAANVDINELKSFIVIMQKFIDNVKVIVAQLEGNTDPGSTDDAFIDGYMATADNILEIAAFSMKDSLSGLSNRYGFDNRLILEWNRAVRDKSALGLVIFSLNNFKNCKGKEHDDLVKKVAQTLKNSIKRSTDFFARWSDDEFAALLPITDNNGVTIVAERIRMEIENMNISDILSDDKPEVSIGVCVHTPLAGEQPADFISKAYVAFCKACETTGTNITFAE